MTFTYTHVNRINFYLWSFQFLQFLFMSCLLGLLSFPHSSHSLPFAFTSWVVMKRLVLACHFRGISLYWLLANSMGVGSEAMQQRHRGTLNTCPELLISWLSRSEKTDGKGSAQLHPLKKPLMNSWISLHLLVVLRRTWYLPPHHKNIQIVIPVAAQPLMQEFWAEDHTLNPNHQTKSSNQNLDMIE